jgi:hypothetical protein
MQKYKIILILIFSVILPTELLFGQAGSIEQKQTVTMEQYEGPDITDITGFGNCQWLYPLDEPNETLLEQPEYNSKKLYYYAAKYGDADDNIHTLVLDERKGTGTGYDTVYVDLDNDNRIDANNEKFSFQLGSTRKTIPVRIKLTVTAGGKKIPYYFNFSAFPYTDEKNPGNKIHANARNSSIFVGKANFGKGQYKIAIADLNSNGLFNDVEKGIFRGDRFFVDLDSDGKFKQPSFYPTPEPEEGFSYGKYTCIDGKWYCIEATPDGTTIQITPAQPQFGTVLAQKNIETVELYSDIQSQTLRFSEGSAEAITGIYDLAVIQLSKLDWKCRGTFRSDRPQVTIKPGVETRIDDVFPLQVSIEPTAKSPSDAVELKPTITGANGGSYRCPRGRGRPVGNFEIQNPKGQVIISEKFEYG